MAGPSTCRGGYAPLVATVERGTPATVAEQVRSLQAVTDVALSQLAVEDLLAELLTRVRDIFDVDTAVVLLHDPATDELVPAAASGIDAEVRHGVRTPLGDGFAGQVAVHVRTITLDGIEDPEMIDPVLRDKGVHALAGAPLVVEGRVIGVLHVGSLTPRRFRSEDVDLLEAVAGQVALAVEARRANIERAAGSALQRSLLPSRLPAVPGLELAARYLSAGEGMVGGDWYDVFLLPSGHVGLVIGDVTGRGLPAAVIMGRLRSALRAYALDEPDPAAVLERLDRKLQHFEHGQMATVLHAVVDPTLSQIELSSAGHPLPVIARPGSAPAITHAAVDLPLGVSAERQRRNTTLPLPRGAMVALYTDGLIERRGEIMDRGQERLCAALTPDSAQHSCRGAISALVPDSGWADDAALVVIRRDDTVDPAAPG